MEKNKTRKPSNQTGKYLKYAIGEIVLVMIGILLALQVNDWNEKRKESKQTVSLLKNMVTELEADISRFDREIKNFNQFINSSRMLLISEDYHLLSSDSIYNLLPTNSATYRVVNLSYEKLKNIGATKILDSEELLSSITRYYTLASDYLDTAISWDFEYSLKATDYWRLGDHFEAPILNDAISTPFLENESKRKATFIKELSSVKSRNHIRYAISRKISVINTFKRVKLDAEKLKESIEQELEKVNSK